MNEAERAPVIVVGGGISGLTAAFHLVQGGEKVLLLEGNEELGGNIRTEQHDGFLYDVGPDSFLRTKPAAQELCEQLGLSEELISPRPQGARVYVALDGALHPMPEGLALGVPTRPGALLDSSLLSPEGKLRAFCEPFVPPAPEDWEESIFAFTARRLGSEMASRIAAPLLSGVFAGDAERLSMPAAFPQLVALERKFGSLFSGMNGGQSLWTSLFSKPTPRASPFLSLRCGLGSLIEALAATLPKEAIWKKTRVQRILSPAVDRPACVLLDDGRRLEARHIVIAGPPWVASDLLRSTDDELASSLGQVRGYPTATVFFGLRESEVHRELGGSGFIVPPGEGRILAATWISSKWSGRGQPKTALVRAFVGGARGDSILQHSDRELLGLAENELTRFMGPLGRPLFGRVFRYERGTPQPELGHAVRMERAWHRLQEMPWLSIIGPGYGGVGIPDCARRAREFAEGLLKGTRRA